MVPSLHCKIPHHRQAHTAGLQPIRDRRHILLNAFPRKVQRRTILLIA
jgi:hypothetical protein